MVFVYKSADKAVCGYASNGYKQILSKQAEKQKRVEKYQFLFSAWNGWVDSGWIELTCRKERTSFCILGRVRAMVPGRYATFCIEANNAAYWRRQFWSLHKRKTWRIQGRHDMVHQMEIGRVLPNHLVLGMIIEVLCLFRQINDAHCRRKISALT